VPVAGAAVAPGASPAHDPNKSPPPVGSENSIGREIAGLSTIR
jgi:hypothetical protein